MHYCSVPVTLDIVEERNPIIQANFFKQISKPQNEKLDTFFFPQKNQIAELDIFLWKKYQETS